MRTILLNNQGMSFVEIMITSLLFAVMLAGVYTAFLAGNRSWANYDNQMKLQRDARGSLIAMMPDLREAENISLTQSTGNTNLTFTTPTLGSVTYVWSNSGGSANQIIRTTGTTTRTLARNISALSFTSATSYIDIDLTATATSSLGTSNSFNLKHRVALR